MFSVTKFNNLKNCKQNVVTLLKFYSSQAVETTDYSSAKDYKLLPKPGTLEFFRDFMPTGKYNDYSFIDYATEMNIRFGDIFIMPGLFGKPDMVMLYNTKDFETVFRNEGQYPQRQLLDSLTYYRTKVKGDFFGETIGLPTSEKQPWRKLRTTANPILMKPRNLTMYLKPMRKISLDFVEKIKEIRDSNTLEVPGNFSIEINRFAFESVALVALNKEVGLIRSSTPNSTAERLFECTRKTFEYAYDLDIQPSIWKFIKTPTFYKSMKVQDDFFNITLEYVNEALQVVEQRQQRGETNPEVYSVLERLLLVDRKAAVVIAMDMLFGGVDTSSATLAAILLCLAKNPDKQQKLREEIVKAMPEKNSEITESNTKSLPYLRAVIKEALRYYPNGNGPIRQTSEDMILSGYRIPKGSMVTMNSNILVKNDAYFPRAKEFLPERWLRDENKVDIDPFSYLPFGIGPRICIGKRLVEMELEVAIMNLIRNFNVEFQYDATKPFRARFINAPAIPLKFKFSDIGY